MHNQSVKLSGTPLRTGSSPKELDFFAGKLNDALGRGYKPAHELVLKEAEQVKDCKWPLLAASGQPRLEMAAS
ncbi:MAG: hypothetical protein COA41_11425 [Sphingopyxis sp.]|nr:MAG: hypothetical protein COA41_11425 [Sphingopyxis sp.]